MRNWGAATDNRVHAPRAWIFSIPAISGNHEVRSGVMNMV